MNQTSSTPSSPPTPPSPLPISVGPDNQKYLFSRSPTPSPPFSSHASAENLPLLQQQRNISGPIVPSPFSLDLKESRTDHSNFRSSCLKDLLTWFMERCCNCCTRIA